MNVDKPARVRSVAVEGGFEVRLVFTDGVTKTVDLGALLRGPIFDPMRRDRRAFERVRVDPESGTITWPNGADICPDVLRYDLTPAWADDKADEPAG